MAGEIRSKAIVQTAEEGLASGRVGHEETHGHRSEV